MTVLVVTEGVVILILTVLVAGLLRSHGEILKELHRLGVDGHEHHEGGNRLRPEIPMPRIEDAPATDIIGSRLGGGALKVAVAGARHTTLLAFLSSGCATCAAFWRAFDTRVDLPVADARLVIVTKGSEAESESTIAGLAPDQHPLVMSSAAWHDYKVPVSPYFILVDGPTGQVLGEGAAMNWAQLANLMREATSDAALRDNGGYAQRQTRIDEELIQAGIAPGHPSLYPKGEASQ